MEGQLMPSVEEKAKIDISILYQVAANRLYLINQQAQTAISISSASTMAFAATIGVVFASMDTATNQYKVYADIFIILISALAILVSIICREVLKRSAEVGRQYEEKLTAFECENEFVLKPQQEFNAIWNMKFCKYEPYKMTSWLMVFAVCLYSLILLVAIINLWSG